MERFIKKATSLVFVFGIVVFFAAGGYIFGQEPLFEDSNILLIDTEFEFIKPWVKIIPPEAALVVGERMKFRAEISEEPRNGDGGDHGITAKFVSPEENAIFQEGEDIWVAVEIIHPDDVEITRARFYAGNTEIGETSQKNNNGHWGIWWAPEGTGDYDLRATIYYKST